MNKLKKKVGECCLRSKKNNKRANYRIWTMLSEIVALVLFHRQISKTMTPKSNEIFSSQIYIPYSLGNKRSRVLGLSLVEACETEY